MKLYVHSTMDMSYSLLALLFWIAAALKSCFWERCISIVVALLRKQGSKSAHVRHSLCQSLDELIEQDGAGSWPPKTAFDGFPNALRPYHEIYLEMARSLAVSEKLLDHEYLKTRRATFRATMSGLLAAQVNISEVIRLLEAAARRNSDAIPRDVYNAFYCCIAVSRHAYRWATIPVVKLAQEEKVVDFPPELDLPWPYLQARFGVEADSGNNTANVLHNFTERGERMYKINLGMSKLVTTSEDNFFRLFYDLEVQALPVYRAMVQATVAFEGGNRMACGKQLGIVADRTRTLLRIFYEDFSEENISKSVWLSYIQGFQGWGVGRYIDGAFVRYDGLSGNHVLFFQALDAFLGLDRYLTDENMDRYIPKRQRDMCDQLRKHCFRPMLGTEDDEIKSTFTRIVNNLKVFRAAHRTRVMPYLRQPAPERLAMTAGKSVLESGLVQQDMDEILKPLDDMLTKRLRETI